MNDSQLGDQREQQAAHGGVHREQRLRLYHQAQFLFSGTVLLLDQTAVGGDYKTGIPALFPQVNRSAGHTHSFLSHMHAVKIIPNNKLIDCLPQNYKFLMIDELHFHM